MLGKPKPKNHLFRENKQIDGNVRQIKVYRVFASKKKKDRGDNLFQRSY